MRGRVTPAVGLFLLSPLVAEYLLGNIAFSGILGVVFLAPMYGGGALLIREAARRAGWGWPTVLLLAVAYGVLQPGLLDQSLFNPSYEGYDFQSVAHVPALGVSAHWAMTFVGGHAVWSIAVPIAIVETLVPERRTTPWLGRTGLAVTAVAFLLGATVIFQDQTEQFLATVPQMAGTVAVTAALVTAAFAVGRPRSAADRPRPPADRPAPRPWLVAAVALVAANLFFVRPESWLGVAIGVVLVAVTAVVVARWSRRPGWSDAHRLALAGGALTAYAWGGFALLTLEGAATTPLNLAGQLLLVLGAAALLFAAARTARRTSPTRTTRLPGPGTGVAVSSRPAAGCAWR
jgi:hypothetical protein